MVDDNDNQCYLSRTSKEKTIEFFAIDYLARCFFLRTVLRYIK